MPINRKPGPVTNFLLGSGSSLSPSSVATASATGVLFSGISGADRVTGVLDGVSLDASDTVVIQLGTSTGMVTTGYNGAQATIQGTPTSQGISAAEAELTSAISSSDLLYGLITMAHLGGNTWSLDSTLAATATAEVYVTAAAVTLPNPLTQWHLTLNTATFDAGTVMSLVEG